MITGPFGIGGMFDAVTPILSGTRLGSSTGETNAVLVETFEAAERADGVWALSGSATAGSTAVGASIEVISIPSPGSEKSSAKILATRNVAKSTLTRLTEKPKYGLRPCCLFPSRSYPICLSNINGLLLC